MPRDSKRVFDISLNESRCKDIKMPRRTYSSCLPHGNWRWLVILDNADDTRFLVKSLVQEFTHVNDCYAEFNLVGNFANIVTLQYM